jgi:hypothetical protein
LAIIDYNLLNNMQKSHYEQQKTKFSYN